MAAENLWSSSLTLSRMRNGCIDPCIVDCHRQQTFYTTNRLTDSGIEWHSLSSSMSHHSSIEEPYVLATLPKALNSETGHIYTSIVRTYKASRWRRRPEIVAAVDGEGLSIYHVSRKPVCAHNS